MEEVLRRFWNKDRFVHGSDGEIRLVRLFAQGESEVSVEKVDKTILDHLFWARVAVIESIAAEADFYWPLGRRLQLPQQFFT